MAKNKYTIVWKPDCEVNSYVTWIELDFNFYQYMDKSRWKELFDTLAIAEDVELNLKTLKEDYLPSFQVEAVFKGHHNSRCNNV